MKWRHSLIYLLIFLGLGGVYFFQKTKMEEKEAAEQAAQKVFDFRLSDLRSLEILRQGEEAVHLSRNGDWKITRPIQAETDGFAVESYGITLMELTRERLVDGEAQGEVLGQYGLDPPGLRVRFQVGEKWEELSLGDKNPSDDGFYASAGHVPGVFLISSGMGEGLFKAAGDLRRRQLLSFPVDSVEKLWLQWHEGESLAVEKVDGGGGPVWVDPAHPEKNIDSSKVVHVLQQLQWLRARNFLEEEPVGMEAHGLSPPLVTVALEGQGMETPLELKIGRSPESHRMLTAFSPQLGAVVEIDFTVHDEIPKNILALENRSILTADTRDVMQVRWRVHDKWGRVYRQNQDSWDILKDDGERAPLADSWLVQSLLWNVGDMEFLEEIHKREEDILLESQGNDSTHSFELWGEHDPMVSLSWTPSEKETDTQTIHLTQGEKHREVVVPKEPFNRTASALEALVRLMD